MKTALFNTIIILIFSIGCQDTDSNKSKVLSYESKHIEFQTPNCEPEHDPCFLARLTYPEFNSGDSMAVILANRIIRNSTLDFMGMGDAEATSEPELPEAVNELNISFQRFRKEFPTSSLGWEARIITEELYRNDTIIVFETKAMTYFGGAHPNKNIRYFNFNRATGGLVPLSRLITDLDSFSNCAEVIFRKKYMTEEQSYVEAGFDFLGNQFMLPANYALLQDSIKLHYNHYEIAPYSAGDFEITVGLR